MNKTNWAYGLKIGNEVAMIKCKVALPRYKKWDDVDWFILLGIIAAVGAIYDIVGTVILKYNGWL